MRDRARWEARPRGPLPESFLQRRLQVDCAAMADENTERDPSASSAPPGVEPEEIESTPDPKAPDPSIPQDTDDTRGLHFKSLLSNGWFLSITATLAIAAFVVLTLKVGAAVGGGAAAGVLLLGVLIVFLI